MRGEAVARGDAHSSCGGCGLQTEQAEGSGLDPVGLETGKRAVSCGQEECVNGQMGGDSSNRLRRAIVVLSRCSPRRHRAR